MTASSTDVLDALEQLVSQFNRGTLDLPDGFLDRNAPLRLNGLAYEETLGRPVDDPLVRLVGRGPSAYRFLAKALRYALPDAVVRLGALERRHDDAGFTLAGAATLSGTLRTPPSPFSHDAAVRLRFNDAGRLLEIEVTMDEAGVRAIRAARTD
jgi:hypothetical protein